MTDPVGDVISGLWTYPCNGAANQTWYKNGAYLLIFLECVIYQLHVP